MIPFLMVALVLLLVCALVWLHHPVSVEELERRVDEQEAAQDPAPVVLANPGVDFDGVTPAASRRA